jgi:hypothetical protein
MAARNPSTWTAWIDDTAILDGSPIVETGPDDILDDSQYILDAEQMAISDDFRLFETTSATWVEVRRYHLKLKDICGSGAATINAKFSVRVWTSAGGTLGNARVVTNSDSQTTGTFSQTSPTWEALTTVTVATDDTQDDVIVSLIRDSGAGTIYLSGVFLTVDET